jgi:hypothetical protein
MVSSKRKEKNRGVGRPGSSFSCDVSRRRSDLLVTSVGLGLLKTKADAFRGQTKPILA